MKYLPRKWVVNAKLLFILTSFSLLYAFSERPLESVVLFLIYINVFMGFILIPLLVTNKKQFKQLLIAIIISGIFPIAVSIFQYQTGIIFQERQTVGLTRYVGFYHDAYTVRFYGEFTLFSSIVYLSVFKIKSRFYKFLLFGICGLALIFGVLSV